MHMHYATTTTTTIFSSNKLPKIENIYTVNNIIFVLLERIVIYIYIYTFYKKAFCFVITLASVEGF